MELYTDAFVERLRQGAQSLIGEWGLSPQATVTLLNISENATFRADDPQQSQPIIIRVHRPNYHTRAEIESELCWIEALREAQVASVPAPLVTRSGGHIAAIEVDGEARDVVAFEYVRGREPSPDEDLVASFRRLGAISAKLHQHAKRWARPDEFVRKTWNYQTTVGSTPHWGDWRDALGLTPEGAGVLEQAAAAMRRRLAAFGEGPHRFGLIHADLRLANLLVDGETINVIDFDDCGFGWFAFDFAAAISFFETDPQIPALQAAWVEGYRTIAPLEEAAEAELATFIMLRRLQLTAWIASHRETPTAIQMGSAFTDGTIEIADRYLANG